MSSLANTQLHTELHPAYAPFLPLLERLSPALSQLLRGQMLQFEVFAGRLESIEVAEQGEFAGLSGLTNRGEIENILQSELLLQTEAPLEFLRRLVEAETLFHDRQYADPGAKQAWRVIVSIGPQAMGHARLITLAAVLFLARVAYARGGRFEWCFLPSSGEIKWFNGITVNAIKRFLRSAAYREVNSDDVALAREIWDRANQDRVARDGPKHADWVIGPAHGWGGELSFVLQEPNSLSFDLQPPLAGEDRSARIQVIKAFQEVGNGEVVLAGDQQCLSALEQPFARPSKERKNQGKQQMAPGLLGWEPRYLSVLSGNYLAIRMADGLLIRQVGQHSDQAWHWFMPLIDEFQIAGLEINQGLLTVVLLRQMSDKQRILFQTFQLSHDNEDREGTISSFRVELPEDLQRTDKFALPSMVGQYAQLGEAVTCFGRSGSGFKMSRGGDLKSVEDPEVLLSRGPHHITSYTIKDGIFLEVHRRKDDELVRRIRLPLEHLPNGFHDMVWSQNTSVLAYAIAPGQWYVRGNQGGMRGDFDTEPEFQTSPAERVLSVSLKNGDPHAVIWSDARYGGTGTIEAVRFVNGERRRTTKALDLGDDSDKIVHMSEMMAKFLAIAVDGSEAPERLISLRHKRPDAKDARQEFDLNVLKAGAPKLLVRVAK